MNIEERGGAEIRELFPEAALFPPRTPPAITSCPARARFCLAHLFDRGSDRHFGDQQRDGNVESLSTLGKLAFCRRSAGRADR